MSAEVRAVCASCSYHPGRQLSHIELMMFHLEWKKNKFLAICECQCVLFGGSFILLTYSADYTDTMSGGHRLVWYTAAQAVQQILRAVESDTDDTNDSSDSEHVTQ